MKTSTIIPEAAKWYIVDASDKTLGRLSAEIAHVLIGKHKVMRSTHQLHSDHVIVINTEKIVLKGNKSEQKEYIRHSGHIGSLKRTPFARAMKKDPTFAVLHAVKGMLPQNKLRPLMLKHLHLFAGAEHAHEGQQPLAFDTIHISHKKKTASPSTSPVQTT